MIIVIVLTQGSTWHVLPKGLHQAASFSNLHHSGNTTPCLLSLQGHTQLFKLTWIHSYDQIPCNLEICLFCFWLKTFPLVRYQCSTCAVEASSGKPLRVYRVLDTCKATKPLLKTSHSDMSFCMPPIVRLLLHIALEWDVAHIVPEDEEAVGEMFGVFSPGRVSRLPAGQHATTAKTLHLITLP